jgi:DNA-binding NarL/FixJ family response regulator
MKSTDYPLKIPLLMTPKTVKTIILAEDDELQRKYFKSDIEEKRGDLYEIIADTGNGSDLLKLWKTHKPDIIITDLHMPGLTGNIVIEEIRKTDKETIIIVLTQISERDSVEALYPLVNTYLIKSKETPKQLLEKLDSIAEYKTPEFRKYILDIMNTQTVEKDGLNYREFEICSLIKSKHTNQEIAEKLFLSIKTIEKNITTIYKKFRVKSREELIDKLSTNKQPWKFRQ